MSFQQQIGRFSTKTKQKLHGIRRGVCVKLFSAVILDTPVLTGRLRANWRFQEGTPQMAPIDRTDKSGQVPISEVTEGVARSTGHYDVYLTNNLPYAHRVEFEGWSHTKAPEGMMRRNVIRFNRLVKVEAAKK